MIHVQAEDWSECLPRASGQQGIHRFHGSPLGSNQERAVRASGVSILAVAESYVASSAGVQTVDRVSAAVACNDHWEEIGGVAETLLAGRPAAMDRSRCHCTHCLCHCIDNASEGQSLAGIRHRHLAGVEGDIGVIRRCDDGRIDAGGCDTASHLSFSSGNARLAIDLHDFSCFLFLLTIRQSASLNDIAASGVCDEL